MWKVEWAFLHDRSQGQKIPPTTSCSLVTKQAVARGLLTKWVVPSLLLTGTSCGGSFVVVVLWLPEEGHRLLADGLPGRYPVLRRRDRRRRYTYIHIT